MDRLKHMGARILSDLSMILNDSVAAILIALVSSELAKMQCNGIHSEWCSFGELSLVLSQCISFTLPAILLAR